MDFLDFFMTFSGMLKLLRFRLAKVRHDIFDYLPPECGNDCAAKVCFLRLLRIA